VSRQHARIVFSDGSFRLEDLGSANGTFFGEERTTKIELNGRVEFLLGEVPIVFEATKGQAESKKPPAPKTPKAKAPASKPKAAKKEAETERAPFETRVGMEAAGDAQADRALTQRTLKEQLARREDEIARSQTRLGELKSEVRKQQAEVERQAARTRSVEKALDGAHKQVQQLRDEVEEGEANLDDSVARVGELEGQIEGFVRKESEHADELSNLRIEVVHKDRQLQELRKALDLKEEDHQQMREEMRRLEDRFSEDTRLQEELDRRLGELREVINEKENHVHDLRHTLQEKEFEIRQVKLGVGISDLEEERRKLLEDFYAANTEVRKLEAALDETASRERERDEEQAGLKARVRQLQRAVEEQRDISEHADYRARVRDVDRLGGELRDAHASIADLTRRLIESDAASEGTGSSGESEVDLSGAIVAVGAFEESVKTLRSYLKDVGKGVQIVGALDPKTLADKEQKKLKRAKPDKAFDGVNDALKIIDGDLKKLKALLPKGSVQ